MKKLLVPCDFSTASLNAFQFALDIAGTANGTVHVLHVIELPVLHDSVLMPVLSFEQNLIDEMKEKAETEFNLISKKYNPDDIKVTMEILLGKVWDKISQYTEDHAIDLIVMGSRGATGMREFIIGSNAEKVVRQSTVPVIVVKGIYKGPIKHIVFPNTLETEAQEDLIMKVKALQDFFGAHLHIVWINTPLNFTSDSVTRKRLEQFAKHFQFKNYTIAAHSDIDAEKGILEYANYKDASLIAMGTHSRKGLSHILHGSLAESIVNHTDLLVWSYTLKNESVLA